MMLAYALLSNTEVHAGPLSTLLVLGPRRSSESCTREVGDIFYSQHFYPHWWTWHQSPGLISVPVLLIICLRGWKLHNSDVKDQSQHHFLIVVVSASETDVVVRFSLIGILIWRRGESMSSSQVFMRVPDGAAGDLSGSHYRLMLLIPRGWLRRGSACFVAAGVMFGAGGMRDLLRVLRLRLGEVRWGWGGCSCVRLA